jgi:hypothetical protein
MDAAEVERMGREAEELGRQICDAVEQFITRYPEERELLLATLAQTNRCILHGLETPPRLRAGFLAVVATAGTEVLLTFGADERGRAN